MKKKRLLLPLAALLLLTAACGGSGSDLKYTASVTRAYASEEESSPAEVSSEGSLTAAEASGEDSEADEFLYYNHIITAYADDGAYADTLSLLERYAAAGWEGYDADAAGLSDIYAHGGGSCGYRLQDIDGDGTPELLLGETPPGEDRSAIYDLLTLDENGESVSVFSGGERSRMYLYSDGTLLCEGSSGANDSTSAHMILHDGVLDPSGADAPGEPEIIEFLPFSAE